MPFVVYMPYNFSNGKADSARDAFRGVLFGQACRRVGSYRHLSLKFLFVMLYIISMVYVGQCLRDGRTDDSLFLS